MTNDSIRICFQHPSRPVLIRDTLSPMSQGITGTLAAVLTLFIIVGSQTSLRAALWIQGGSIRGKIVADIPQQRRTLPGVVVNLSGDRLGDKKLQTVTDFEGAYSFTGLLAGDYVLSVEFQGFKKYEQKISIQID